jgi:long-chain acyl-CoA synthetase
LKKLMKENLKKLNDALPSYSRVHDIEIKDEPFEKTPKKSIKRFLYK